MSFTALNYHTYSCDWNTISVSSLQKQKWFFSIEEVLGNKEIVIVFFALKKKPNLKQNFELSNVFPWWLCLPSIPTHTETQDLEILSINKRQKFFPVICSREVKGKLDELITQTNRKKEAYCSRKKECLHIWNTWSFY